LPAAMVCLSLTIHLRRLGAVALGAIDGQRGHGHEGSLVGAAPHDGVSARRDASSPACPQERRERSTLASAVPALADHSAWDQYHLRRPTVLPSSRCSRSGIGLACPAGRSVPSRGGPQHQKASATGRDQAPGPCWVRVTTVELGHGRAPTVAYGSEEPQVGDPSGGLGASGSRRAATDRRRDQHDPWRTVADRRSGRALTPALTCGFPSILPGL
jgi:hypothetical protein